RTVVAISHRLSTIRHCDQIVVLDRGQVAQRGTYEELASQEGIFRELVRQEHGDSSPTGRTPEGSSPATAAVRGDGDLRRQLARCPLFAHLNSNTLAFLERVAKEVRCARGQV